MDGSIWMSVNFLEYALMSKCHMNNTGCPNKNVAFFTKHVATTFCSIAKILFDSERVCINLNSDTLASPVCKIFFAIHKYKDRNVFFPRVDFRRF